jgi:hypothetical protein
VKLKSLFSKREWAFYFLWFCPKRSDHQAGFQGGGHESRSRDTELEGESMPAIAPIEDLRAAQKELLETMDINELKNFQKVSANWMEKHLQAVA